MKTLSMPSCDNPLANHLPRFLRPGFMPPKISWGDNLVIRTEYLVQYWKEQGTRVVLYPAGELALYLLERTHLLQVMVGLGDSNPGLQGAVVKGFTVLEATALAALKPDVILVSSHDHETEILTQLAPLAVQGIALLGLNSVSEVPNPIDLWAWNNDFQTNFSRVSAFALLDERRAFILDQFARQCLTLPGDFAEIGVFRGASSVQLGQILMGSAKRLHLFDTFEGMPPTDSEHDLYREGELCNTSLEEVRQRLIFFPHADFHPGFFPATSTGLESEQFSFVHVDVDIYQSVLDCCEFFYPRLTPAGIIIFDDYGFVRCQGARAAVDEFFASKPETPCYLPTGQCVVVRHP